MRSLFLAAIVAIVLPAAGWAGTSSHGCAFTGTVAGTAGTAAGSSPTKKVVAGTDLWCYRFVAADAVTSIVGPVQITAPAAVVEFDPDLFQAAVASTARVIPRLCPSGVAVDTTSLATISRSCLSVGGANGNASLDGTEGAASTQNAAIRVGPGVYYFEINVVCEAGDTCQVSVKGEGDAQ